MRRTKYIYLFILTAIFLTAVSLMVSGCGRGAPSGAKSGEKAMYRCPMHPTYTSDRPGDCPICGMKLVKFEQAKKAPEGQTQVVKPAEEKTLQEICVEHECTMKDCAMHVKTDLKPGERVICPICGEVISTSNGKVVEITQQAKADMRKERKPLYYRNPMNPEATSPVPMKDSMGMDYVPVYEDEGSPAAAGPTIMVSSEKQQLIGIKTAAVDKRRLEKAIHASGKIAYDPELVITQEEFIQAFKNEENTKDSPLADVIERARSLTEAARRKLRLLGMSDEQIAELEKTKKADMNLYLPRKGENVWAYISIYEYEIGLIHPGDTVEIEAVAYPGEKFSGKVIAINPVLDAATRTNQVRVEVANLEDRLKPEMFVNATIKIDLGEKLAVPESAVLDTGLRKIVYLSKENDTLESREITVGQKAEGYYEVPKGLQEGDVVVTSGNFLIDSESKLKSASQSAEHKHGQ